jgi:hypothetical protein
MPLQAPSSLIFMQLEGLCSDRGGAIQASRMEPGHSAKRDLVPSWVGGLGRRLFEPIDIAPLVFFRVVFGGIMLWEVYRYFSYGWIERYFIEPTFFFKYQGFGWVRPFAGDGMYIHFAALGVLAACILLGFCYRLAAALFFLGITYVFLLDQTNYLNHLYLICILSFILIFVPAHRALSLDAALRPRLRSSTAPAWTLWLLRFQIAVPYFFGAIAKFNADWLLAAQPMRMWLADRTDFPVIGRWFTEPWAAYFMSWGGFLFDLLFVPLLLWRRTRPFAFAFAAVFHLMNFQLFHIGVFTWLMLVASLIFLPPPATRFAGGCRRSGTRHHDRRPRARDPLRSRALRGRADPRAFPSPPLSGSRELDRGGTQLFLAYEAQRQGCEGADLGRQPRRWLDTARAARGLPQPQANQEDAHAA